MNGILIFSNKEVFKKLDKPWYNENMNQYFIKELSTNNQGKLFIKSINELNPDDIIMINKNVYEMIPDQKLKDIVLRKEPKNIYNFLNQYMPQCIIDISQGKNISLDGKLVTLFIDGEMVDF